VSIATGTLDNDAEAANGVTKAGTIAARNTLDIGANAITTASTRCSSARSTT
jgi:filamentous hemagglutinin